jgi:hypothetical protein
MDGNAGTQLRLPAEANGTVVIGRPIESQVEAVGAIDSSVCSEAHEVLRIMSTPRTGGLGPVKPAVRLNKPHVFQLG